jgi:putative phage-type endonuclease
MKTLNGQNLNRSEWLEERRKSVGASDTPILWGESSYSTPLKLWKDKLGLSDPEPETREQLRGKRLEKYALEDYENETGRTIERTQVFLRHPSIPYLTATLDGMTRDGRIVEVKTVGPYALKDWGAEGSDEVPLRVVLQVQHQMLVAGHEVADVGVLFGGETFRMYTVPFDTRIGNAIVKRANEFWQHVESRTPPKPTGDDCGEMASIFPEPEGMVILDSEWIDTLASFDAFKASAKASDAAVKAIKVQILEMMGPAEFAELPDGRRIKRSVVKVAERTQTVKAYSFPNITIQKASR